MSAINATRPTGTSDLRRPVPPLPRAALLVAVLLVFAAAFLSFTAAAFASRAATGELAFYPCTQCHPVTLNAQGEPTKPLPNGMKKHEIELIAHDILGEGDRACLACHDSPQRDPGMLILADGSLVRITGDVSRVCQRCHFEKYQDFQVGIHGKHAEKCTSAGCHNPHTPQWIYVEALPPFQGTGFEVMAVGDEREAFTPFAAPPPEPEVLTPTWLVAITALGAAISVGLIGYMTLGRRKR